MLPDLEQLGIRLIKVGVDQFAAVVSGQGKPELPQTLVTSASDAETNHLMREARHRNPQIPIVPLEAATNNQFIHLQGITLDGR